MLVDASSSGNIKPGAVMEALYREYGEELPQFALLEITGLETYYRKAGRSTGICTVTREAGEDFS